MSTDDPYQPIRPFVPQEAPPPDPLREFYREYPHSGRGHTTGPRQPPAMLGLCRFVNGREVQRGLDCPHFKEPDSG
jgi:hypothetical protein